MRALNFGSCCNCRTKGRTVRNIMMLPFKAPKPAEGPGSGWGCFECHLPAEGASAVFCDPCYEAGKSALFVVVGYPGADVRMPIEEAKKAPKHDHDELYHLEMMEERIRREIKPKDITNPRT